MNYFRYETRESEIHLYPIVCWHVGVPQSDSEFIRGIIKRIEDDPLARWVYLGDGGECVTKLSKGDIYTQFLNPVAQLNELVKLLTPIKDKGLFGIKGNHGNRIYKETGLDFDETLMARVGLPYLGTAAYWHLKLRAGTEDAIFFSIYSHHGVDSGSTISSKVAKGQAFDRTFIADAIMTAHSHVALELPPRYYATLANPRRTKDPIRWDATHEYICGCAYDSRTGYAEDKGYAPLLPAHLMITFRAKRSGNKRIKEQSVVVIRKGDL